MEKRVLPIVRFGEEILQKQATEIKSINNQLLKLIVDMTSTMYSVPGVGLAAPQIGESIQLAVLDTSLGVDPKERMVILNPQIVEAEGEEIGDEGCLSIPGFTMPVKRYTRILLQYMTVDGHVRREEFVDYKARVIQHELDHLTGKVILDRVSHLKRNLIKQEIKKLKKSGQW